MAGLRALSKRIKIPSLHTHQIDHTFKAIFLTDGDIDGYCFGSKPIVNHLDHTLIICAGSIHLVHVCHAGNMITIGLMPHCLRLGFHSTYRAKYAHRPIKDSQRTFHFCRKIHVPGSIYDIYLMIHPGAGHGSRRDGDAAFAFLLHPVRKCVTVVHLTHLVQKACVIQNPLCSGRLSGINVCHDADVSYLGKRTIRIALHNKYPLFSS